MAMPWDMDKSLVDVIQSYDSRIVGESDGYYDIMFFDKDRNLIEARLFKNEFESLPYNAGMGTHFSIVLYKVKGVENLNMEVWPVAKYWHESWRK